MILKASNILKQKLFTKVKKKKKKPKSMLSLKIMGVSQVKMSQEEDKFKGIYELSFGKTFKMLKYQLTA